jgi:tRNA threonylcarbamoyladenosine biosynthesis protein TsaE
MSAYNVYHLDLYRLQDPADIEILGLRDISGPSSIMLIEWPQRAAGNLPAPDYLVDIHHQGSTRKLQVQAASGRNLISGPPGSC